MRTLSDEFVATAQVAQGRMAKSVSTFARVLMGRSLADCVDSGRDNILQLRLLAAFMVILGHCNMGGTGSWFYDPLNMVFSQVHVHAAGLMVFFTISGFLITMSFERRPHLLRFLRARVLRLWPALVFCMAAWAFVFGPLLTKLPLQEYFSTGRGDNPYGYLWHGALIFGIRNNLPGLFQDKASVVPGQVDTPIWSIAVEAGMYLWVAGAGVLRLYRFPWLTSLAIAVIFSVVLLWPMTKGTPPGYVLTVKGFFGAGAIAWLLRRYIPVSTGLLLAIVITCFLARHTSHALPLIWLTVGYSVFWLAYVPRLPSLPGNVDLSYGVYLWAWPVQQCVVIFAGVHEPLVLFAITVPIVLAFATLSWVYVEKPALRLKDFRWRSSSGRLDAPAGHAAPAGNDKKHALVDKTPAQLVGVTSLP